MDGFSIMMSQAMARLDPGLRNGGRIERIDPSD